MKLSHSIFFKNQTTEYTDAVIIEGILKNSNETFGYIYKHYFPKIKKMVWAFRNTKLLPDDIFQEGLTRAVINIQSGKFRGESSFYTYLNSTCRNICLKELSKRSISVAEVFDGPMPEETENFELLAALVQLMHRLDDKCSLIIDLRFNITGQNFSDDPEESRKSIPFEQVAEITGMTPDNARQRFKRCLDKLKELVQQNPEMNNYYD